MKSPLGRTLPRPCWRVTKAPARHPWRACCGCNRTRCGYGWDGPEMRTGAAPSAAFNQGTRSAVARIPSPGGCRRPVSTFWRESPPRPATNWSGGGGRAASNWRCSSTHRRRFPGGRSHWKPDPPATLSFPGCRTNRLVGERERATATLRVPHAGALADWGQPGAHQPRHLGALLLSPALSCPPFALGSPGAVALRTLPGLADALLRISVQCRSPVLRRGVPDRHRRGPALHPGMAHTGDEPAPLGDDPLAAGAELPHHRRWRQPHAAGLVVPHPRELRCLLLPGRTAPTGGTAMVPASTGRRAQLRRVPHRRPALPALCEYGSLQDDGDGLAERDGPLLHPAGGRVLLAGRRGDHLP